MRYLGLVVLMSVSLSGHAEEPLPSRLPPDQEQAAIAEAERVGQTIHRHDRAAWVATDEAMKRDAFRSEERLGGWITEDKGEAIDVTFLGKDSDGDYSALYRITVGKDEMPRGSVQAYDPPQPLSDFELSAARARDLAVSSDYRSCSDRYNSVVLPPGDGDPEYWTVYLLPATTRPEVVPVGGTHRFRVDPGAGEVVDQREFTKSCINLQKDKRAAAMTLTHLLDPVPTEAHVFWNLYAGMPLFLATPPNGTIWALKGGRIRLVKRVAADD